MSVCSMINDTIPDWVMSLLWFEDGPLMNIKSSVGLDAGITMRGDGISEPSAISLDYPIHPVKDCSAVEKLAYSPSYRKLSAEQRWVYLNWLKNPFVETDVGYAFLFYYGLERHLLPGGEYEAAYDAIKKLMKAHPGIDGYAFESLLVSTILREDKKRYLALIAGRKPTYWPTYLVGKRHFGVGLTADELIMLAGTFGFKNRRYIKSDHDLFRASLEETLLDKFDTATLPLDLIDISDCPMVTSCFLANSSISSKIREFRHANIIESRELKDLGINLLHEAHDMVKNLLRKR